MKIAAIQKKNREARGFTLVEILVVLAITGLVTAGLVNFMVSQSRSYNIQEDVQEMEQNARVGIDYLTGELRKTQSVTVTATLKDFTPLAQGDVIRMQYVVTDVNGIQSTVNPVYRFNQGVSLYSTDEGDAGRISASGTGVGSGFIGSFITQDFDQDGVPETPLFQVDNPANPNVVTVTIIARTRKQDRYYTRNNGYRQIVLTRRVFLSNL